MMVNKIDEIVVQIKLAQIIPSVFASSYILNRRIVVRRFFSITKVKVQQKIFFNQNPKNYRLMNITNYYYLSKSV